VDLQRLRGGRPAAPAAVYYPTATVVLSERHPARAGLAVAAVFCGFAALSALPTGGRRLGARYLSAPIDTWLTFYNFGYSTAVTPEDGMDVTSSIRSNVLSQSVVVTRTTVENSGNRGD
jgi:hypothetical protein